MHAPNRSPHLHFPLPRPGPHTASSPSYLLHASPWGGLNCLRKQRSFSKFHFQSGVHGSKLWTGWDRGSSPRRVTVPRAQNDSRMKVCLGARLRPGSPPPLRPRALSHLTSQVRTPWGTSLPPSPLHAVPKSTHLLTEASSVTRVQSDPDDTSCSY